ncbi:Predicted homoserine dehydrogenase, contains C-terminal SAF domain [Klenkia soli]|uniref:Predicted homoserine dehydrogenase, contains C-terminal SAF domain n=1 Tax=Klenkia soli TaxID=1052260 RepID=A0A1H0JPB9_9ACTN|nr:oxidoreductase [Klenkia soli]SDO45568.1 Predicted homoserine dehydrogenase, contains C-terminal SAF domain [Klenkia soli]
MSYSSRLAALAAERGRPVRIALVGAGQMGRGFAAQAHRMTGVHVSAVVDVVAERASEALVGTGQQPVISRDLDEVVRVVESGGAVALDDLSLLTDLPVDVVVEATGVPEIGAQVAVRCLLAGKDIATLNVESDVTIGRLLHDLAQSTGAIYSICRGDEPVECKILVDYARDLSMEVVMAGKGKNNALDPTATPASLTEEAKAKGMNPKMLCSFVDGSKAMIEMAALANTTGLGVSTRGMHGPASTVPTLQDTFALVEDGGVLEKAGVVDYCTGPVAPGVFVVVRTDDPYVNHELSYLKMGAGPYFALYRPYHLASVEAPLTVAEMVVDRRASLTSEFWTAEVGAVTKADLAAGSVLEGVGGAHVHGLIEDAGDFAAGNRVPLGVIAGARLVRDVPAGEYLTYDDVELAPDSVIVALRKLQDSTPAGTAPGEADLVAALGGVPA